MSGTYSIRVGVIDDATAKLKAINKEMETQLAPQRRLQRETAKFYKLQTESQKKWQTSVADFARSAGMPKIGDHFDRMAATSRKAAGGVTDLAGAFKSLIGPAAIATLVDGLEKAADQLADKAVRLRKLSAITGTSPTNLSAIEGAGRLNNVATETTDSAMVGLSQALQEAIVDQNSLAARLMQANGLNAKATGTKWQAESPDKFLPELADLVAKETAKGASGATVAQMAAAFHVPAEMIAWLQKGGTSLKTDIATANKINPQTDAMQKSGEHLAATTAKMKEQIDGLSNELTMSLVPAMDAARHGLGDWAESIKDDLESWWKWRDAHMPSWLGGNSAKNGENDAKPTDPSKDIKTPSGARGSGLGPTTMTPQDGYGPDGLPTTTADRAIDPNMRGLLDTIASKESGGRYDAAYGGGSLTPEQLASGGDLPQSVIASGPNKGQMTSASGRYQFENGTWREAAAALHLTDHSPGSQDKAGAWLARRDYKRKTGRDLDTDLTSKDPAIQAGIAQALHSTWTSLPGGIEQGQSQKEFGARLAANIANETGPTATVAPAAAGPRVQIAANENKNPLGLLDINITGNVPNTTVSANAKGPMFGGPPKIQQIMPGAG